MFIFFLLNPLLCHSNPYDRFGEASALYVGTCYGLEYLREKYCPNINLFIPELCVNAVLSFTPNKLKSDMRDLFVDKKDALILNARTGIDGGFQKTISMMNGDKEKSCITYGSSLVTVNTQLYEELKRFHGKLK